MSKTKRTKKPNDYVNNKEFYNMLVKFFNSGEEKIPDAIGKVILQIANNLATSGKFSGYTWKDEMIGDGVFLCIRYLRKFNPERTENPFAYFTQICYNAFIKRIKTENKKLAELAEYRNHTMKLFDTNEFDDTEYGYIDDTCKQVNQIFIKETVKKEKPKKPSLLDNF